MTLAMRNMAGAAAGAAYLRDIMTNPAPEAIASEILRQATARGADKSICPSEVARAVGGEGWQELMEPARAAARRLVVAGEAEITQGGGNVSGGQRQRLAIARALVKRPAIYLFDDSFSALDARTDQRLRAALRDRTRDATVIIVAQRVATIRDADKILVLDDGELIGSGSHDELLCTCPTYAEIVDSQLSAEEAAA